MGRIEEQDNFNQTLYTVYTQKPTWTYIITGNSGYDVVGADDSDDERSVIFVSSPVSSVEDLNCKFTSLRFYTVNATLLPRFER